jgi:hypothetical protein
MACQYKTNNLWKGASPALHKRNTNDADLYQANS